MAGKWRDQAAPVVAEVVRRIGLKDPKGLRVALRNAYPFGERSGYPYRAWLYEIDAQIGGMRPKKPDPGQASLFDEITDSK
jgi:hypothetical protein